VIDEKLWEEVQAAIPKEEPTELPAALKEVNGNRVLVVDGDRLKTEPDKKGDNKPHMDFVEGDNDAECDWVRREFGKKVLLIDDKMNFEDWPFILYHEAHERRSMSKGMSYDKAHTLANAGEKLLRIRMRAEKLRSQP
jgi:hypothetical protein